MNREERRGRKRKSENPSQKETGKSGNDLLTRLSSIQQQLQAVIEDQQKEEKESGSELRQLLITTERKLYRWLGQTQIWEQQKREAQRVFGTSRSYNIIVADPPWQYRTPGWRGGTNCHYNNLSLANLSALPVLGLAAQDCVLLMWATWPKLQESLALIRDWGFTYKTIFMVWIKQNSNSDRLAIGTGCYTAANSEPLLLATRGFIARYQQDVNFVSVYVGRRTAHSEKPSVIMDMILDRFGELPRIELFSRCRRRGWDAWGNQCSNLAQEERETQLKARQDKLSALAFRVVRDPGSITLPISPPTRGHIYAQTIHVEEDYANPPPQKAQPSKKYTR